MSTTPLFLFYPNILEPLDGLFVISHVAANLLLLSKQPWYAIITFHKSVYNYLFHDGRPYHIETSLLTCRANQWTGFYMIGTFVMKELIYASVAFGNS